MNRRIVILGTAHRKNVGGNCSPDKKFYEYQFSREVCFRVKKELEAAGFTVFIDLPDDLIQGTQTEELRKRCRIVKFRIEHHVRVGGGERVRPYHQRPQSRNLSV